MRRLTEEETDDRNETSSEPDERKGENERKKLRLYGNIKINGIKKEFIIDTGSPTTLMPPNEKILK